MNYNSRSGLARQGLRVPEMVTMSSRVPISILILSCLYLAVGVIGFVAHFSEIIALHRESVWIALTECLAILAGASMLFGHNWARWLALAWMAFHVAISFPAWPQVAIHSLILAAIAWVLFRPNARCYFRAGRELPAGPISGTGTNSP
jgi:hypothetical protein